MNLDALEYRTRNRICQYSNKQGNQPLVFAFLFEFSPGIDNANAGKRNYLLYDFIYILKK